MTRKLKGIAVLIAVAVSALWLAKRQRKWP
jgi:hypothetical protein